MLERLASSFATTRLLLRLVEWRDLEDLSVVHADDEVTRYLPYDTWRSSDDANAWYERNQKARDEDRSRQFAIIDTRDGRVIGAMMIFNVDATSERAEIGYVLGKRDWGRGLMREALAALIDRGFDELGLRRLEAFVDPRNVASDRLLLALGFTREGLLRQRGVMKGRVVDSSVYGLLRAEWSVRRATIDGGS